MHYTIKIDKQKIILYLLFIFMFEPKLFVKIPVANNIYIVGAVLSFVYILLKLLNGEKLSAMFFLVVSYRLSFMLQTFFSGGDITMWGYFSIIITTLCLIIDYYSCRCPEKLLDVIINILLLMLIINLYIGFKYKSTYGIGIIDDIYFIGIRTRFTDVIFPTLALSMISDYVKKKKFSIKTLLCFIVSLITIFYFWIATALVGIVLLTVLYILIVLPGRNFIRVGFNIISILIGGLLINWLFVYENIMEKLSWITINVLHKTVTLSNRTFIWERAKKIISKSVLWGYGQVDNGTFVYWGRRIAQAHNQWLQLMYDGGIITTILFFLLFLFLYKPIKKNIECKTSQVLLIFIAVYMVMMITEIYSYTPYLYLLVFVGYNCDYFVCKNIVKKENYYGKNSHDIYCSL